MNISIPIPPTESLYYQGTKISQLELPPAEQLAAARTTGTLSAVPVQFHGSRNTDGPGPRHMQTPHSFTRNGADALAILRASASAAPSATAALSQALAPARLTPAPLSVSRAAAPSAHTKGPAK